jgi:hypothetical protein
MDLFRFHPDPKGRVSIWFHQEGEAIPLKQLFLKIKELYAHSKYVTVSLPYLSNKDPSFDEMATRLYQKLSSKTIGSPEELTFVHLASLMVKHGFVYTGTNGHEGHFTLKNSREPWVHKKPSELLAMATGDRRTWRNQQIISPMTPYVSNEGHVRFDKRSLLKIRKHCVYSSINTEVSGFAAWSTKTDSFKIQNKALLKGSSSNVDTVMFYVEFHTHPLYSLLEGTNEILNPPSGKDLSSLLHTYIDGSALSLIIAPNGIFSIWVEPVLQKALCFGGYPDTRPRSKSATIASSLWNLVKDVTDSYGDVYGTEILKGANICNPQDHRGKCAQNSTQSVLWCFYKWSARQEELSYLWAAGMAKAFSLTGLLSRLKRTQSKRLTEEMTQLIAMANDLTGEGIAATVPLLGATFTPWRLIENESSSSVKLAPARVMTGFQPPADRFETANPGLKIQNDRYVPTDCEKFFHNRNPACKEFKNSTYLEWDRTSYHLKHGLDFFDPLPFTTNKDSLPLNEKQIKSLNVFYDQWRTKALKTKTAAWKKQSEVLLSP